MKITIKHLNQAYGKIKVLHDINLEIPTGMFGLLGRNGAGKSTLMKTLVTLLPVTAGEVSIVGTSIQAKKEVRSLVGYLPQDFSMYGNMTVYEAMDYLAVLAELPKKTRRERINYLLEQVNLTVSKKVKVKNMSGGMKRRLGIAQALLNDPKILVVDEPTAGLDPEERLRFRNLLAELSEEKIVLLSTHIASDIEATADTIAILDEGRIIFSGSVNELLQEAQGKIYTLDIAKNEYPDIKKEVSVISLHQDNLSTTVRFIEKHPSKVMSHPLIQQVQPTLEDAYMYLLAKKGGA